MNGLESEIREEGWSAVNFDLCQFDREEFTRVARNVIVMAAEDPAVKEALSFELDPSLVIANNNPSFFGVSNARNSADDKLWIHGGFQTEQHVRDHAPQLAGTKELREYFESLDDVLHALETAFTATLSELSTKPERIQELFFPKDRSKVLLHVRTVRYLNLDQYPAGHEVIAGHGDMSLASIQFYETHKDYLKGAKVDHGMIRWDADPDRLDYINAVYGRLSDIEYDEDAQAAFFFGFAIAGMDHAAAESGLGQRFPGMYHAGFRPEQGGTRVDGDWKADDERIADIGFLHPRLEIVRQARLYRIPNVQTCRPLTAAT